MDSQDQPGPKETVVLLDLRGKLDLTDRLVITVSQGPRDPRASRATRADQGPLVLPVNPDPSVPPVVTEPQVQLVPRDNLAQPARLAPPVPRVSLGLAAPRVSRVRRVILEPAELRDL